jgi:hypothetical protein
LVQRWYAFGTPLVRLWYAVGTPLVRRWYAFGAPLVRGMVGKLQIINNKMCFRDFNDNLPFSTHNPTFSKQDRANTERKGPTQDTKTQRGQRPGLETNKYPNQHKSTAQHSANTDRSGQTQDTRHRRARVRDQTLTEGAQHKTQDTEEPKSRASKKQTPQKTKEHQQPPEPPKGTARNRTATGGWRDGGPDAEVEQTTNK